MSRATARDLCFDIPKVTLLQFTGEQMFDVLPAPSGLMTMEARMGTIRILDRTGDTAVEWNLADNDTVRAAETIFDRLLRSERKVPFSRHAGESADRAVQIDRFDPTADEIIFVRPITGGA